MRSGSSPPLGWHGIGDRKNGKCSIDSRKPPTTNPAADSGPFMNSHFLSGQIQSPSLTLKFLVDILDAATTTTHATSSLEGAGRGLLALRGCPPHRLTPFQLATGFDGKTLGLDWVWTLLSRKICLWDFFLAERVTMKIYSLGLN